MKSLSEQINQKYIIQANKLLKYSQLLYKILPPECHKHIKVANIRDQNLMLIADSPVWATRLRQLAPQILKYIRQNSTISDGTSGKIEIIHHIQIGTRYQAAENDLSAARSASGSNRQAPHISDMTSRLLTQSASSISYQPLKDALLKIAGHGASPASKSSEENSVPGDTPADQVKGNSEDP